jgi:hypothetical protein
MSPKSDGAGQDGAAFRRTRRSLIAIGGILSGTVLAMGLNSKSAKALALPDPPSNGGTSPSCFLAGTQIETPEGFTAVEMLKSGDHVRTPDGRTLRVKRVSSWEACRLPNQAWPEEVAPVKVARSAIADNVPSRDLYLSANHALYLDGKLVMVGALVNGVSITRCRNLDAAKLCYFHVEVETHDVIVAEGVPVETFLASDMVRHAQVAVGNGRRAQLASRTRSAFASVIDSRTSFDRLRDRIEDRAETTIAV